MSPIPLSRRAQQTPPSPIRRLAGHARAAVAAGKSVYHLNIGQPDVPTPRAFFEGLQAYSDPVVAYEVSEGNLKLRTAWAAYINRTVGLQVPVEQLLITTGASEALIFMFMICCDPGDEILIFDPTYANYIGFAAVSGVNLVSIETSLDQNFSLPSTEEIQTRITPRTRAILLCSPNNPTGTVYSREELQRLLDICNERNIFLVVDETYREFVYDGRTPLSVLHLEPDNERVVVIDSLSKRFSLCGARLGCLITPNKQILEQVLSQAQARLASPSIDQFAAAHMLEHLPESYLQEVVAEYENRRNVLFDALESIPDIDIRKPSGAFYSIVRLPVSDASEFARYMLTDFDVDGKTVFVAPANGFYMSYRGGLSKVRIACVLHAEALNKAARILAAGLEQYQSKKK